MMALKSIRPTVSAWLSALKVRGSSAKATWLPTMPAHSLAEGLDVGTGNCVEPASALTPQERVCLLWTLRGKTDWEVAALCGISQRAAAALLQSATVRMDAPNKQSAALKAFRAGLLETHAADPADPGRGQSLGSRQSEEPQLDVRTWPAVQMQIGALRCLNFRHLLMDSLRIEAPKVGGKWSLIGRTLWQASFSGRSVGLQWQWIVSPDEAVMLQDPLGIETNAQVVNAVNERIAGGPPVLERLQVLHALEWRKPIVESFAAVLNELRGILRNRCDSGCARRSLAASRRYRSGGIA